MNPLSLVVTVLLLLLPGVVTSFYRARSGETDRGLLRRRRLQLWGATAAAFGVYAFLCLAEERGWFAFWQRIPWAFRWSESPAELAWLLDFVLWWPFAVRVLCAVRPEAKGPFSPSPERSASLAPRRARSDLGTGWWVPGWVLLGFAAVAILVRVLRGEPAAATPGGVWWPVFLVWAGGAFSLLLTPVVTRLAIAEPEPLDRASSPELMDAYARLRRHRARAFVALATAMAGLFAGLAAAVAWWADAGILGLIGGIGGTVVGIAGGVLGVVLGNERMRIRRRLDEISAGEERRG